MKAKEVKTGEFWKLVSQLVCHRDNGRACLYDED